MHGAERLRVSRAWGLRGRLQKSSQGGREQIREGPRSHVKEFGLFVQRAVGNTAPSEGCVSNAVVRFMFWGKPIVPWFR